MMLKFLIIGLLFGLVFGIWQCYVEQNQEVRKKANQPVVDEGEQFITECLGFVSLAIGVIGLIGLIIQFVMYLFSGVMSWIQPFL